MTDDTIIIATADLPKIEVMYAFIVTEAGGEGVCGFNSPSGWMPMVCADMARMDSMRSLPKEIAGTTGQTIKLIKFSVREEVADVG